MLEHKGKFIEVLSMERIIQLRNDPLAAEYFMD